METWKIILGSGVAVAIITAIKEFILWTVNRRVNKQDKQEEKADAYCDLKKSVDAGFEEMNKKIVEFGDDLKTIHEKVTELNAKQDNQCEALRAQLGNTIEYLAGKYIKRGKITPDELKQLESLFVPYEKNGGNGTRAEMFHRCQTRLDIVDAKEINK